MFNSINKIFNARAFDRIDLIKDKNLEAVVTKIVKTHSSAVEETILDGLNELIKRGLLKIEVGNPVLVTSPEDDSIHVQNTVRIVCSQQEQLDSLQSENKKLKEDLKEIQKILTK
jgi:hypothetical protein